ncbi:group III truncated hemoglobin [Pseudosulfitobacter sp. DSM 107133]|uniref:group III truncated hemoglobin n=1 Tax=Pseudosulfitobacter sp. DSM 107133 TaxID=2883100 RepID=UPI000DF26BF1|nr:group III truncated hemoglobin [Pseudosulfitobacter sp. DSM 107133]UOA26753.1 Group 3 truncated hemoglobin ctb [Pseudosulfitobacter sp. DSM 107133]
MNQPLPNPSMRPVVTAQIAERTGLSDDVLRRLVHSFYDKIRQDSMLGPIFAAQITDWGPHLERMVDFWSSVALMTGRYHGAPVPKHVGLPINQAHFDRWLTLFRQTANDVCAPAGAEHVIGCAERIARSLVMAVESAKAPGVPNLRG